MVRHRYIVFLLFAALLFNTVQAQPLSKPKKVRAKGSYLHEATGTVFPERIGDYERSAVHRFDKKEKNVSAEYIYAAPMGLTAITIYVYPAQNATDSRFREEYNVCTQALALRYGHSIDVDQHLCFYKKDGYRVNGCKVFFSENGTSEALEFYECGEWFFKIRVTSKMLDSTNIYKLTKKIVEQFDPVNLVKHSSLSRKSLVYFNDDVYHDSGKNVITIGYSLLKLVWVHDHVDSLEQAAGFPDLYLLEHVDILMGIDTISDIPKTNFSDNFRRELKSLITSGYLDEFVSEQLNHLVFVPENHVFDFEGYAQWRKTNPITLNIRRRNFEINYYTKEEAAKANKEEEKERK